MVSLNLHLNTFVLKLLILTWTVVQTFDQTPHFTGIETGKEERRWAVLPERCSFAIQVVHDFCVYHAAVISTINRLIYAGFMAQSKFTVMFSFPPSTVPFDMEPEILPEGSPVPLNDQGGNYIKENPDKVIASMSTVVPLNPKPWLRKWENLQTHLDGYRC